MKDRIVRIDPEALLLVRVPAALSMVLEWFIFTGVTIYALVETLRHTPDEAGDESMRLIDWIDFGMFAIAAVILISLLLVLAVGALRNLRGEFSDRLRKACLLVTGANVLFAIWWLASLSEADEASVAAIFLAAGGVSLALALLGPKAAEPAAA